jgi:hypothetical protein
MSRVRYRLNAVPAGLNTVVVLACLAAAASIVLLVSGFERRSSPVLVASLLVAVVTAANACGLGGRLVRRIGWPTRGQVVAAEASLAFGIAIPFLAGTLGNGGAGFNDLLAWGIAWFTTVPLVVACVGVLWSAVRPGKLRRAAVLLCASGFALVAAAALAGSAVNLATSGAVSASPQAPTPPPGHRVRAPGPADVAAVVRASGTALPADAQQVVQTSAVVAGTRYYLVAATVPVDEVDGFRRDSGFDPPVPATAAAVAEEWPDTTFASNAVFSQILSYPPHGQYGRGLLLEATGPTVRVHLKIWQR